MVGDIQLIVFSLDINGTICEYGVPIIQVQEIIRLSEVTIIPQVPSFVAGIINLRGQIIPIIDLKDRFAMGKMKICQDTRIIVLYSSGQKYGILVDDVQEVLYIDGTNVETDILSCCGENSLFSQGVAKVGKRLIIMLDLEHLLNESEMDVMKPVTCA